MEQDAEHIFTKYIAKDAVHNIETTQEIRAQVINRMCKDNTQQQQQPIDANCFAAAQQFVYDILQQR